MIQKLFDFNKSKYQVINKEFARHSKNGSGLSNGHLFHLPCTSKGKGAVENWIGVIRRLSPKGTDLNQFSDAEIKQIETLHKNRSVLNTITAVLSKKWISYGISRQIQPQIKILLPPRPFKPIL